MTAVPYGLELPYDRSSHYAEVVCGTCRDYDDLKLMPDGDFLCRYCRAPSKPFGLPVRSATRYFPAPSDLVEEVGQVQ